VADIENQQSQSDILKALLRGAAQFAERVAMFIVKGEQAIGWRISSASDPANSQPIGGVSLPLSAQTGLIKAIHSQASWSGSARENAEDHLLVDQLGGSPESAAVIPLVVRGKVVAVLYADSSSAEASAINSDALDVLARVAAMTVNIVSIHRGAVAPKREEAAQPAVEATPTVAEVAAPVEAPAYVPQIEPQVEEAPPAPAEVAAEVQPTVEAKPEEIAEPVETQPATVETGFSEPSSAVVAEPISAPEPTVIAPEAVTAELPATAEVEAPPVQAAEPEPQPESQPSVPQTPATQREFASQYVTPLGSTRRYGVSEPELPIEVGEEERRLHNDARRFARLLVSEIKLYNENKVKEGRTNADLYARLREDIDRSRQMYDKRVAAPVAARHDYFHQELVNLLAEGDVGKLGQSYPGAAGTA
ncbi:MAG TPA: hypothetical protein VNG71_08930, partial [Pyrinomonadaceae bacterium]|nr:hypothetical protein [Pyrinomonadaceae bacterium]